VIIFLPAPVKFNNSQLQKVAFRMQEVPMAIIRWYERPDFFRIGEEMERLQREMNRLYSDFFGRGESTFRLGVFPHVNVSEDSENLYVRAELPGIMPEDIEISVQGETLTLRGEKKLPEAGENVNYHRREREGGLFRRIISLPTKINPEAVDARFTNGVLKVILPKAPEVRPKEIKVKVEG
jgi:HSP20 family protein